MNNDRTIILCVLGIICMYIIVKTPTSIWKVSKLNGNAYYVKNLPDADQAADHLARLDTMVKNLIDNADPKDPRIQNIKSRWSGTLSETPSNADNVAYSLGKNSIFICVREKNGALTDVNTSMFVLIHELAHVSTDSYGHTPEFWKNMKYLLEVAEELGNYTYVNHDETVESLCGRVLGTNPISCVKNKTCESEKNKI